ncbi:MAG: hypothetical protein ACJ746_10980 [Bryobacteraceae bacterium]
MRFDETERDGNGPAISSTEEIAIRTHRTCFETSFNHLGITAAQFSGCLPRASVLPAYCWLARFLYFCSASKKCRQSVNPGGNLQIGGETPLERQR